MGNYLEQLHNHNIIHSDDIKITATNDTLFEQSVTLTAKMWPSDEDEDNDNWVLHVGSLNIRSEHVPIIVGIITSVILIIVLIAIYVLWRYCCSSKKGQKPDIDDLETVEKKVPPTIPSYSAVFLDPKDGNYMYNSRVVELIPEQEGCPYWLYKNHYLETIQQPSDSEGHTQSMCEQENVDGFKPTKEYKHHYEEPSPMASLDDCSLPQISEFSAHPCQYASSSILDDCYLRNANLNLRTRSLPSCVRMKKRPLSTIDNPAELYDKVNFSKKRKNRMRNDEAAIIALSKSRSQFFDKDTDILVDNEAVIVYDERTAL